MDMPRELASLVERANLDPGVHVIVLSGNGKGFCGGADAARLSGRTEGMPDEEPLPNSGAIAGGHSARRSSSGGFGPRVP